MILFQKDWENYPTAVVHLNTSNTSFLELAALWRDMGVENHAFILALVNPELEFVNPHDENIDDETMGKVICECVINPWYYFREVAMAPPLAGTMPRRFQANRANMAAFWLFFNHVTFILIQPRQTGKSFSIDSLNIGLLNIWATNTEINLLTRSDALRDSNLTRLKKIQDELPFYLNRKVKGDIFNTEEIKLSALTNSYKGHLSGASPKAADKVGRGFTSPISMIDEAVYIENVKIAISSILFSGNAAREEARRNGTYYGTVFTTTSGDLDDREGSYIYGLVSNAAGWNEIFYDSGNEKELVELIMRHVRASGEAVKRPIVDCTFSYRQLGYDDAWMRRQIEDSIAEGVNADRDLFNKWKSGSLASPIPNEYADLIRACIKENFRTELYKPFNCLFRWYISEEEIERRIADRHSFIAGIDTSDGSGGDDIAMVIRDHVNAEVICVATFNEINLIKVADIFVSLLLKYRNMVMIIERKSSAAAIIDYMIIKLIQNRINPMRVLFNMAAQQADRYENIYNEVKKSTYYDEHLFTKNKGLIGFTTSGSGETSRSDLYGSTLVSACKYSGRYLYDKILCGQLLGLVRRNGRVDHPPGGNDDLVMASMLSYWFIINGRNMEFYGIDRTLLLKHNEDYLKEKYSDTTIDKEEMYELEQDFQDLLTEYKQEKSKFVAMKLELKIKMLANELNANHNHSISVEQMLEDINRQNKYNRN